MKCFYMINFIINILCLKRTSEENQKTHMRSSKHILVLFFMLFFYFSTLSFPSFPRLQTVIMFYG